MSTSQRGGRGFQRLALLLAAIPLFVGALYAPIGFTQAGVDWKYYGAASVDGLSMCFYDANGVVQEPGNQIRVWTKCLPQEGINSVLLKNKNDGKKIVADASCARLPAAIRACGCRGL